MFPGKHLSFSLPPGRFGVESYRLASLEGRQQRGLITHMENDVAVFLDLDNLVIGAGEADLPFDIELVLDHIKSLTEGRVVLCRAYGDWRQKANLTKELAASGFELQSTVRLSKNSKNLADMQLVVDAMSTMIDRQTFHSYVLISGDRDFAPLVQALRKRGKKVIGVGIRHAVSSTLVNLCDYYIYYDELADAARQMLEVELEGLLIRALDQLLQENDLVAASLLKQRMQALSKGAFGRSPQGRRNFRKLLGGFPHIVELEQSGTTLYVGRPGTLTSAGMTSEERRESLPDEEAKALLSSAIAELTSNVPKVRASLLKQRMQEISNEAFDETLQGDKTFRRFLERYQDIVALEQDGSTLYVRPATSDDAKSEFSPIKNDQDAKKLLLSAMDILLGRQDRIRASLLKQEMQDLSNDSFDETALGYENFRRFLERNPDVVSIQQKGTTLLVSRAETAVRSHDLHVNYLSGLKRQGLRVVPPTIRLAIIKGIVRYLGEGRRMAWQELIDTLYESARQDGLEAVSKSYVNDVLKVSRRSNIVGVGSGGNLASAPIELTLQGDRPFQDAVIHCDLTYLEHIQALDHPFVWDEAAIALYGSTERTRYLQVIFNRFKENGR